MGEAPRRELLEAAYELIAENGLEGLRTRDIAARAGVNISTLHYYFGTKEALIEAVVEHVVMKFAESAAGAMSGELEPLESLREHFESAWNTFQRNKHLSVVLQELALRAQRDARTRAVFRNVFKGWSARVESVATEAVRAGALRPDVDPKLVGAVATSFIMGAMTQLGVNPKAFDFRVASHAFESWLTRSR